MALPALDPRTADNPLSALLQRIKCVLECIVDGVARWWTVAILLRAQANRRASGQAAPLSTVEKSGVLHPRQGERSASALRGEAHLQERASYGPSARRTRSGTPDARKLGLVARSPGSSLKSPSHPRRPKWGRSATTSPSTRWRP